MATAASRPRPAVVIGVLAVSGMLVSLVQTIVVPLLPQFPVLLSTTPSTASWLITSTLIAGAVSAPVFGRLGDMYGKRRMLLLALTAIVAGSALSAAATGAGLMLVGRTLQGTSFAVIALGISIMRDELPADRVGGGIALMSSSLGIGAAVGLPLAGGVAQLVSWRWLFGGVGIVGLLLFLAVRHWVRESPQRTGGRFDVPGAVGLTLGLLALLLAISKASDWGWGSPAVLGLLGGAAVVLPLWARYELRAASPLVDLRVTARPAVLLTNVSTILVGFAMFASFLLTAQMMQADPATGYGFGLSLVTAGVAMLPMGGAMALLSPLSARISARFGGRVTLALGAGLLVLGNAAVALRPPTLLLLVLLTSVSAAGTALAYSALPLLVIEAVPTSETAAANSLNTLMRQLGTSSCAAVVSVVAAAFALPHVVGSTVVGTRPQAYTILFLAAAGSALVAAVIALLIPRAGEAAPLSEPADSGAQRKAELEAA